MAKRKTPKGFSELHIDGKRFKVPMAVHAFIDSQHRVINGSQNQIGQLVEVIYNLIEESKYEFPGNHEMHAWMFMAKDAHEKYSEFLSKKKEDETQSPSEDTSEEVVEHPEA